jgi:hypothetical protein
MVPRIRQICAGRLFEPSFIRVSNTFRFKRMRGVGLPSDDAAVYRGFGALDGSHPYRDVPHGHVDYRARRRHAGEIAYFNYALAREMGLIPRNHPDTMTRGLRRAILDTFAFVIVNEYDLQHGARFSQRDLLPGRYMATRYLQLQHSDRRGTTSGDGRSVWDGAVRHAGVTWDVSSCGTGVTRLCPATAETRRFFKTGSRTASYGCGTANVEEGLAAALMSETFHRSGIATERCLAVIAFPGGFAINVRAARNLLRPSHLFAPLRQGDLAWLRGAVDHAIARERANDGLPAARGAADGYRAFAGKIARSFAVAAATFEREYVFCWLDWDGDNVLLDGGIIDYGSVRQFGLFHQGYRFDDGPRWSTTLVEQKRKARAIVRCFAQIRDALIAGRKRPLATYASDPLLLLFDRTFEETRDRLLLRHVGYDRKTEDLLMAEARPLVRRLDRAHAWFERRRSAKGPVPVPDGITWNAVYSTRDLLRELPRIYARDPRPIAAGVLLAIAASSYASRSDRIATQARARRARELQDAWLGLARRAARLTGRPLRRAASELAARSAAVNTYARVTGDAIAHAASRLARSRRRLGPDATYEVVNLFAAGGGGAPLNPDARRVFDDLLRLVVVSRDGL